ncbi:mediator of RNA polymerase II transcription subunit 8 [Aspergillus udagawae]|uniref:Mediator of RNA polymerase II transcription subunit 8 n=1 Tax=Aspergillus udagawae TaxID=91492 RepID=A0ABQ1A8G2_9EURO|nr:mediator of RNA polymerase II transcription subunit 8 [Aspergillus udagawae]GFF75985.1 mediator of RNA polymerase II transcription subunit 8 [Aspergillus udagawae]GFG11242.1 mediator of RNA polymerase II transcription subunit 8 [Aspergillus udagawae]
MIGFLSQKPRSASLLGAALLLLGHITPVVIGLKTTPGSPCANVCNKVSSNTTASEIVCLDEQFSQTTKGSDFQNCVECQLESTYGDSSSGQRDVEWGLYNLRYAFSSCVYGFPEQVANISSPCVVSCQPLSSALDYDLDDPSGINFDTWCGASSFADNLISQCEFCYNLTSNMTDSQVYLANFTDSLAIGVVLEALRYNCHFRTPSGKAFPVSPSRVFSESLLPQSTVDLTSPSANANSGSSHLALIIALPILGFVILICILAVGCFFFIRWRRKQARKHRRSDHLHARWNDTTISTPAHGAWADPANNGMYSQPMHHPGSGHGFNFVDTDGRTQEVGFSKSNYVEITESPVTVPSTTHSPEHEKGYDAQAYIPERSVSPPQKQKL